MLLLSLKKLVAVLAGLGQIGENSLVTSMNWGSNFRLGVLLTTLMLPSDTPNNPFKSDIYVDCEKCINICPVNAINEYSVDFSKCIIPMLYSKNAEEREQAYKMTERLSEEAYIECNRCQKICPYNK